MSRLVFPLTAARRAWRGVCSRTAVDAFAELGAPRAFSVDEQSLKAEYRRLMAAHHPDRHTRSDDEERVEAAERSAAITRAYATLTRPHRRARHLLELLGAPLTEEQNGSVLLSDEFLSRVFSERFEVEDRDTPEERVAQLRDQNREAMNTMFRQLGVAFDGGDPVVGGGSGGSEAVDLEAARRLTAQLGYLLRLEEAAAERLEPTE